MEQIFADFKAKLNEKIDELTKELAENLDFLNMERKLNEIMNEMVAQVIEEMLNEVLSDKEFLSELKEFGKTRSLRFKGYRTIKIRLGNGQVINVLSPYFAKPPTKKKKPKKKRGPNGSGSHLGLVILGFIGRSSPYLVSEVVKNALLCPSFEVARQMLAGRGIIMGVKVICCLCRLL